MNPVAIVTTIGKNVIELIKHWLVSKKQKAVSQAKAAQAAQMSQAKLQDKQIEHEMNWDLAYANQSKFSWKDEFWTIVLSIPLVMCFVPGLEKYAVKGFENLELVPEWYIIAVGVAMASAFGFRQMVGFMKK